VDKDSGAYFWYNTKDESTQWADTGAEAGAGAGADAVADAGAVAA